jgi:hypothetical protein
MDSVKQNGNGKFSINTGAQQLIFDLGKGNTRIYFKPNGKFAQYKDDNGQMQTLTVESNGEHAGVKDLFFDEYSELRPTEGRSLALYNAVPGEKPDLLGFVSYNDKTTQLTMDDHAEKIIEYAKESITLAVSTSTTLKKIKARCKK